MKIRNKRGFSLIELLAAILIIAVLAAIALPMYEKAILRSRSAEVNNLLTMVRTRQVRKFSIDKEYATVFTDDALKKIAIGPEDYEVNNGTVKTVNDNYELELIDSVDTSLETPEGKRCVIGRYKPAGNEKASFAFAIAYDKSGLACDDSTTNPNTYDKEICSMFGTVVSDIDSLCKWEENGPGLCENTQCGPCQHPDPQTCSCVDSIPFNMSENEVFDKEAKSCKSCRYYSSGNKPAPFIHISKGADTASHTYNSIPENIGDRLFSCNNASATLGDDTRDDTYPEYYAHCHSAYFKDWNDETCEWFCPSQDKPGAGVGNQSEECEKAKEKCNHFKDSNINCQKAKKYCEEKPGGGECLKYTELCNEEVDKNTACQKAKKCSQVSYGGDSLCKPGEVWDSRTCKCVCSGQCHCPSNTQFLSENETCECLAGAEAINLNEDGCVCAGRAQYGEKTQERVFTNDYKHCICNESRKPVFFGTITDTYHATHDVNISNAEELAKEDPIRGWLAACCLHNEVWSGLDYFPYDACCQYANYSEASVGASAVMSEQHINFNGKDKVCCPAEELFYNSASEAEAKTDPNSQYSARPAGNYQPQICHQCKEWYQAVDHNVCYSCPGKTFTTWNEGAKVSECSCPTGTEGDPVVMSSSGVATETCTCTKLNTHWDENVAWVANPTTRSDWHLNNGACKCNQGFTDTYWGVEILTYNTPSGTVSNTDGFCCANNFVAGVYDNNNQQVSGESACCPLEKKFFHNTTYASNTCGVCQNQTDTYVNGTCQPCPGNMVPVYNTSLGYAECVCPQGMHVSNRTAPGVLTDTCVCDLENATWTPSTGSWLSDYIRIYINGEDDSMPAPWDVVNGYCQCDSGYKLARYGFLNTQTGTVPGDAVPSTGYCCPEGKCHEAIGTIYSPNTNYCCDSDVSFNSEPNKANCCTAPAATHYYSLEQLAAAGLTEPGRAGKDADGNAINSVATIGGCSRCADPTHDSHCNACAAPKVPVWNNNTNDGYATCECPAGTVKETPTWWREFLDYIGVSPFDPGCYCEAANSVWNQSTQSCQCEADHYTYSIASDNSSFCCPNNAPQYSVSLNGMHKCCPTTEPYVWDADQECHECPEDKPYVWRVFSLDTGEENCHACPQNKPYQYGSTCCPNDLGDIRNDTNVYLVDVPNGAEGEQRCTLCEQCGTNCPAETSPSWNAQTNRIECVCTNGAEYHETQVIDNNTNQLTHCPLVCPDPTPNNLCGCNLCANTNGSQSYLPSWSSQHEACACSAGRHFVSGCCEDSGIKCCQCNSGYVETPYGAAANATSGCCLSANVAPNKEDACCGKNSAGVSINYDLRHNTGCCPDSAPYYNDVKNDCAVCPQPNTQYLTSEGTCASCPSPKQLGEWNYDSHAILTCSCPAGTSEDGLGGEVYNTDKSDRTDDSCKCILAGTVWNSSRRICECSSGDAIYDTDGATILSCCPHDRYHSGECCPENTTWNSDMKKCVACSENPSKLWYNPDPRLTNHCQECPNGLTPDNWSDSLHAYADCACPSGTSSTGSGAVIRGLGNANFKCRCENANEHYTNDNNEEVPWGTSHARCKVCPQGSSWRGEDINKCLCNSSDLTMVDGECQCSNGNVAIWTNNTATCCPSSQVLNPNTNNPTCCPNGLTPNDTYSEAPSPRCARCSADQYFANSSECRKCAEDKKVDTTTWNSDAGAYSSCVCIVGSNSNTGGFVLSNGTCRCPAGKYYTDENYVQATGIDINNSCKSCPAGSTWDGSKCNCGRGFQLSKAGTCICPQPKVAFSTASLQGCSASDSNCVCEACPDHTCPNGNNGCHCKKAYEGVNVVSVMQVNFGSTPITGSNGRSYGISISDGTQIGYCRFYCPSANDLIYPPVQTLTSGMLTCPAYCGGGYGDIPINTGQVPDACNY